MKLFLLLSAIVATCLADSCDNTFGAYLKALKDEITKDDSAERALETEFRDDFYKTVRDCFASAPDANKCALTDDELKADVYGDDGPLRGCGECQKIAKSLRDKYMHSKEEVRVCFRKHLATAIKEELQPCIQGKISNGYQFTTPDIPDFDEKTFKNIDVAEQGVNYRIVARSRLNACRSRSEGKYQSTQNCLEKGFPGIYSKHCQASKNAKAKAVSSGCNARFDEVKKASCKCLDEKREEWHGKFKKVQDIVNSAQTGTECSQRISDVLGIWQTKLETALKECLPPDQALKTSLSKLIELGCGQVIAKGDDARNKLGFGFNFLRLFLDALNDRITVFCDKNCNF